MERARLERQIGRLLGRNSRAAARYAIRLIDDSTRPAGLRLEWATCPEWDEWATHSEGCYVLRTNVRDWDAETLWRTYVQLTEAEAAFRIQKSELSIRPIWHQKTDRVQAHILVCFLAYVLWKTLEQWQSRAGLGNSPRTILEELRSIQSTDVVLPLAEDPHRELRIRCVVRPEKPRPSSSTASASGSRSASDCRRRFPKCSANFATQVRDHRDSTPRTGEVRLEQVDRPL